MSKKSSSKLFQDILDVKKSSGPNLKYNEEALINELLEYTKSTYGQHYVGEDNIQYMDMVMSDIDNGLGFLKHSAGKYINRLGKKEGFNRKDIMKSLHFLILLLYKADKDIFKETDSNNETDR
jgi:hypothetical protein